MLVMRMVKMAVVRVVEMATILDMFSWLEDDDWYVSVVFQCLFSWEDIH